jgi:hypothetical protein
LVPEMGWGVRRLCSGETAKGLGSH